MKSRLADERDNVNEYSTVGTCPRREVRAATRSSALDAIAATPPHRLASSVDPTPSRRDPSSIDASHGASSRRDRSIGATCPSIAHRYSNEVQYRFERR